MFSLCNQTELVDGLTTNNIKSLTDFYHMILPFQQELDQRPWSETLTLLLDQIKLKEAINRQYKEMNQIAKRWGNVQEIVHHLAATQAKGFDDSLNDYLNRVTLDPKKDDDEEEKDEVSLMSLHSSKGLEFHSVFMVGCEEEWMPHERVMEEGGDLDEERRLVYVGITRAQRSLTLTSAQKRLSYGKLKPRKPS